MLSGNTNDIRQNSGHLSDNVMCESGFHQNNEQLPAVRYCSRCNQCLCNDCLIEAHSDHINDAKLKIVDVVNRGKDDVKNFKTMMENKFSQSEWGRIVEKLSVHVKRSIEENLNKTIREVEALKGKLDGVVDSERQLANILNQQVQAKCEKEFKTTAMENINKKRDHMNNLADDWDRLPKQEKVQFFKEKKRIEEEFVKDLESLCQESRVRKLTSDGINVEVPSYMRKSVSEKLSHIGNLMSDVQAEIKKMAEWAKKRQEEEDHLPINPNPILGGLNFTQEDYKKKIIYQNPIPINVPATIKPHIHVPVPTPVLTPVPITPIPTTEYEYLMTFKSKSSEVLVLHPSVDADSAVPVPINETCYLDGKPTVPFPPEYCKLVNLGDALFISGGVSQTGSTISNCFFLKVFFDNYKYNIMITNYTPMEEKRERHNSIYLDDIKCVLVCGGFYTNTAEITDLSKNSWSKVASMREQRANATMLYYNQKTVYCFGGFHVGSKNDRDRNPSGSYLGSCEFIDIKANNASWNYLNVETLFNLQSLKYCAMGVIHLTPQRILLVGGYDGAKYLSEVNEIVFENDTIARITNLGKKAGLVKGSIFPSSSRFIKWGDNFLNFDFQSRIIQYDTGSKDFIIKN